jgi:hypothetical protein
MMTIVYCQMCANTMDCVSHRMMDPNAIVHTPTIMAIDVNNVGLIASLLQTILYSSDSDHKSVSLNGRQWIGYDFNSAQHRHSFRHEHITMRFKTRRSNGLLFISGTDDVMVSR